MEEPNTSFKFIVDSGSSSTSKSINFLLLIILKLDPLLKGLSWNSDCLGVAVSNIIVLPDLSILSLGGDLAKSDMSIFYVIGVLFMLLDGLLKPC
jgi:hypothetical protein